LTDSIAELVGRARVAQAEFAQADQEFVDRVVRSVAWAVYEEPRARSLAQLAVETTGMGNVADKVAKNRRKTLGTLRDLLQVVSVGVIRDDPTTGITEIAKPVGVVAAVCPSSNPAATPANKAMMALKCRNAIIIAPSPKGAPTARLLADFVREQLCEVGAPLDLFQVLPDPISKAGTARLMETCDLVVATGSQSNVRAAYRSGTPAIGVGVGNVPVIVCKDADLVEAASKIKRSKTFDYATSCSSENSLLIQADVYGAMVDALRDQGGYLLDEAEKARLERVMWQDGRLSSRVVAQSPATIASLAGLRGGDAHHAEFFLVEEEGVGPAYPLSGEKLSVVLTLYRFDELDDAIGLARRILAFMGAGHSIGIHTRDPDAANKVAHAVDVARVLVNQSHCFGNGGAFNNGLNFTLSMGCGTWAGNSISENLNYRHFLNITRLVRPIRSQMPDERELFGDLAVAQPA
jgi:sulfoacetaldehyde dehydrogenase